MSEGKRKRGFAAMSPEKHREISSRGGVSAHEAGSAHRFQSGSRSAEMGRKGGLKLSSNREHMAEIGRKGGLKSSRDKKHMAEIGRKGGVANANSPKNAIRRYNERKKMDPHT